MSRITDELDRAGADASAPLRAAPRAVVATDEALADALFSALGQGGTLSSAVGGAELGDVARVEVLGEADPDPDALDGAPSEAESSSVRPAGVPTLLGGYRGHPVFVPNHAAGRALLHALRLLEEDPLSDMDEPARQCMSTAALAYAIAAEKRQVPFAERVSLEGVDDFLGADPGELSTCLELGRKVGGTGSEPPPPPLDALLVLDAVAGGVALSRGGFPLVLLRAGRPALLAAASGTDMRAAYALLRLIVGTLDLGAGVAQTLEGLTPAHPCLGMLLDERGAFQAGACAAGPFHVRGYERSEAA